MSHAVTQVLSLTSTVAKHLSTDRHAGHTHVMNAFADRLGPEPRAAVGALWHIDVPTRTLTVRHTAPMMHREILGSSSSTDLPLPTIIEGETITINLALACQKTPPSDVPSELRPLLKSEKAYRSRVVVVSEDERPTWLARRLAAIGLAVDPETVRISTLRKAVLGRRKGTIPYVDASCTGTVTDSELFTWSLSSGIGKGKNYGLGLIRVDPNIHS